MLCKELPNGWRYAPAYVAGVLVGGTRQRHFDGTHSKPRQVLDCLQGVRTLSLRAAVPPARPDCPIGRVEGGARCVEQIWI